MDLVRTGYTSGVHNMTTPPYSTDQYFAMAYMAINEEGIKKYDRIEKALLDELVALMWLRIIWTYCSAWRIPDFNRMPYVKLPYPPDVTERMIREGTFEKDAKILVSKLVAECNGRYTLPHKTMDVQSAYYRLVEIPESARAHYGTVYAIARLHYSGNFPNVTFRPYDYTRIFGLTSYSVRRANKSFLSALDENVREKSGRENAVMGYMVAALARGQTLTATTSIYLRSRMDGMSPQEVLMLLWEAGSCSFIPLMLLDTVYGDRFTALDVKSQTEIMIRAGKDALDTDMEASCIRREYTRARQLTQELFLNNEDIPDLVWKIAHHHCASKQRNVQCLLTAVGKPCHAPEREHFFGCPYSLLENAFLFQGMEKIRDMHARITQASSEKERDRLFRVMKEAYLPPLISTLATLKSVYQMDVSEYRADNPDGI